MKKKGLDVLNMQYSAYVILIKIQWNSKNQTK